MKIAKILLILAVVLFGAWLLLINGLKQFPRDSTIRQITDPITMKIYTLFGGKEVIQFNSPEQEKNLKACLQEPKPNSAVPEQCREVATCLNKMDDVLRELKVAYKGSSVHRLTKVSLGWQMELIYTSAEDGEGSQTVIAHAICISKDGNIVKLARPGSQ